MNRLDCLSFTTRQTTNSIKRTVNHIMCGTELNIQSSRPTSRFMPPRSTCMMVMFNNMGIMIDWLYSIDNIFQEHKCNVYLINQQINQLSFQCVYCGYNYSKMHFT